MLAVRYENRADDPDILSAFYPKEDYENYGIRASFTDPREAKDGVILTYGAIAGEAVRAARALAARGKRVGVVLLEVLKPYEKTAELLMPYIKGARRVLFLEEGIRDGGAGMLLYDRLRAANPKLDYTILAVDDHFADPDAAVSLREHCGISAADVVKHFKL